MFEVELPGFLLVLSSSFRLLSVSISGSGATVVLASFSDTIQYRNCVAVYVMRVRSVARLLVGVKAIIWYKS